VEYPAGSDWEIWKCRVEFDERTVYFALAKKFEPKYVLSFSIPIVIITAIAISVGSDCQIMVLNFPEEVSGGASNEPYFKKVTSFNFPGFVLGVFLLNPLKRFLSAYIYLENGHLGLYVIMDWDDLAFTFLDTGIAYLNDNVSSRV